MYREFGRFTDILIPGFSATLEPIYPLLFKWLFSPHLILYLYLFHWFWSNVSLVIFPFVYFLFLFISLSFSSPFQSESPPNPWRVTGTGESVQFPEKLENSFRTPGRRGTAPPPTRPEYIYIFIHIIYTGCPLIKFIGSILNNFHRQILVCF